MRTLRGILTVGVILGFAAASANAAVYTFNKTNDVWNDPNNWDPEWGPPTTGDTAIIPSGKHCRVEDDDQAAQTVQVNGTLGIVGKTLDLGNQYTDST